MAEVKKYIAVDLGAESGRVMLGSVSGDTLDGLSEDVTAEEVLDKAR